MERFVNLPHTRFWKKNLTGGLHGSHPPVEVTPTPHLPPAFPTSPDPACTVPGAVGSFPNLLHLGWTLWGCGCVPSPG